MGIRGGEKGLLRIAIIAAAALLALPASASAATFTVTRGDDPAPDASCPADCSLREAVIAANAAAGADVIDLSMNVTLNRAGADQPEFGDLDATGGAGQELTIRSNVPGTRRTVGAVGLGDRLIEGVNLELTLQDVELVGGQVAGVTAQGGAVRFVGFGKTLALENASVHDNSSAKDGGGVHVTADGVLEIADSQIVSNIAGQGVAGVVSRGGGIHLDASIASISDSVIAGNQAAPGATGSSQGWGGGIYYRAVNDPPQTLTITDTVVQNNRAGGLGSTGTINRGGGISVESSDPAAAPEISVTGGLITGNTVGGGAGQARGFGGGADVSTAQGTGSLAVDDVAFTLNRAGGSDGVGDPATDNTSDGFGAGLATNVETAIADSSFTSNLAGVVQNDETRSIRGNGGAILSQQATPAVNELTIEDTQLANNLAGNGGGGSGSHGGALVAGNQGALAISGSTFSGNQAIGSGGAIQRFVDGSAAAGDPDLILETSLTNNTSSSGGAIALDTPRLFTVARSLMHGNTAAGTSSQGGAINASSTSMAGDPNARLRLVNSTVSENVAGLPPPDPGLLPVGGGILLGGGGTMDFEAVFSTIVDNSADLGSIPGNGHGGNLRIRGAAGDPAAVSFRGTIVSGGDVDPPATGPNCSYVSEVNVMSLGGNLEGPDADGAATDECGLTDGVLGDQVGVDPLLDALADNGGPTETRRLLDGSPAIDAVPPAVCAGTATDQRGYPRPFPAGGSCDSGAYERFVCRGLVIDSPGPFPGCATPPGAGGAGSVSRPSNAFDFVKLKRNPKNGTAILFVDLPGPGEIGLDGPGIKEIGIPGLLAETSRSVAGGRVKLKIRPAKKGKAARRLRERLDEKGKARRRIRVTYVPTGGAPNTLSRKVKLIKN